MSGFYRSITIDHTKCGGSDSSDFPVAFFGTFSYLKTTGNGGKVTSSSGYDIIFCTNPLSPIATILPFERVIWGASTGVVEFHVQVPTLSHGSDTVIYIYYGDSSISTDQQNASGTWDTNYKAVYHFGDGSTLNLNDSTSNAGSVAQAGASNATAATGQVGGCSHFDQSGSSQVLAGSATGFPTTGVRTLELWFQLDVSLGGSQEAMGGWGSNAASGERWEGFVDATHLYIEGRDNYVGSAVVADTSWHHYVAVLPSGQTTFLGAVLYLDGSPLSFTLSNNGTVSTGTADLRIGAVPGLTNLDAFNGNIDEFRISSLDRSADYVTSAYNNQNSPSTFYTIGSEQGGGGGGSFNPFATMNNQVV